MLYRKGIKEKKGKHTVLTFGINKIMNNKL